MEKNELKPAGVFHYFDEICQVPRPSKKEEKMIAYLKAFGEKHKLETLVDEAGNVLIKKPATPGMENRKTVVLQSHIDMVCEKNNDVQHDFLTDPIETVIEGEWLKAKGTTLGADNGIGVATELAILADDSIQHGPLECLFTVDEETGLTGAFALKEGFMNGDILLNLDSEDEGEIFIGCAGGIDSVAEFTYKEVEVPAGYFFFKVEVKGLKGGHSGIEINEGRANANKCMVRFVREAISELDARLASWQGGNMRNAIPFQAEVVLTLPKENIEALNDLVADWKDEICDEFEGIETTENIEFFAENVETPKMQVPAEIQDNLVDAIYACHDGVLRMAPSMPEIVETSSNLAIVEIGDGKAAIKILARSSHEYYKMYLATMIESCFNMAGMKVEFSGSYMGWNPNPKSDILEHVLKVYKEQNGTDGKVQAVHAGLECSIILSKYPNLDVVSFGPTLLSPHTANERCQISCVAPFWNLVKQLLTEIPAK